MNFTLHQLMVFATVAKTGSLTKASVELNLTQPAVSIQLRNFQQQFELPLTETIGKRIKLSDFGLDVLQSAEQILESVNQIRYKVSEHKGYLAGKLKIASVSTGKYVIPYFVRDFLTLHPDIDLALEVGNRSNIPAILNNAEADLALVSILPQGLDCERIELLQNRFELIGNGKQKFPDLLTHPEELIHIRHIVRENGSGTRLLIERFFEDNNLRVNRKLELASNEAVKQAVLAGLGCSIMPLVGIKKEILDGELKIISLKGLPLYSTWQLIWLRYKKLSPAAKAFVNFVQENKQTILSEEFAF